MTTSVLTRNYARAGILINGSLVTDGTVSNINGANIDATNFETLWGSPPLGLGFTDPWWTSVPERLPNLLQYIDPAQRPPGNGESDNPFRIYNETDLRRVGTETGTGTWNLSAHYRLMDSITLTGSTNNWTAIGPFTSGVIDTPFTGTFDGRGFTISGINMSGEVQHQGFFSAVNGATVSNLNLTGTIVTTHTGGIAGGIVADNKASTITNCSFAGTVTGVGRGGGVVGTSTHGGTITFCIFNGTVSGNHSGGIVGYTSRDGPGGTGTVAQNTIRNNFSFGTVTGTGATGGVGGVVGNIETRAGWIENNISIVNLSGTTIGGIGGIVGGAGVGGGTNPVTNTPDPLTVQNNIALGQSVSGTVTNIGRIAGQLNGNPVTAPNNNYANASMRVNTETITTGTATNINGANITNENYASLKATLGFSDDWWITRFPDLSQYLISGSSLELDECLFCGLDFDECECECFLCFGLDECECDDVGEPDDGDVSGEPNDGIDAGDSDINSGDDGIEPNGTDNTDPDSGFTEPVGQSVILGDFDLGNEGNDSGSNPEPPTNEPNNEAPPPPESDPEPELIEPQSSEVPLELVIILPIYGLGEILRGRKNSLTIIPRLQHLIKKSRTHGKSSKHGD